MKLQMARAHQHHLVLVPGLDSTGRLFEPLLSVLPSVFEASVVRFPANQTLPERDWFGCVRSVIPWDHPYILVAESTAGPLALRFVQAQQQDIRAVVLAASFVSNPIPTSVWPSSLFGKSWLEKEPTAMLVREHLLGDDAPDLLVEAVTQALLALAPGVRAARIHALRQTNAAPELESCRKPLLYLRPAQDRFVAAKAVEELLRLKPSAKVVTIPGPHLLFQRNPRQALEAIREFLSQLVSE